MIANDYNMQFKAFQVWLWIVTDEVNHGKNYCGSPRYHHHIVSDDGLIFAGADVSP